MKQQGRRIKKLTTQMDIGVISIRYARALIAYAQEQGVEDVLYEEFSRLAYSFYNFPQLRYVLSNPILPNKEKRNLICTAANGEGETSPAFIRFIDLVLKQHREFYLQFMALSFLDLYRKKKHIGVGHLITAVPIDDETREEIRKTAGAHIHVEMELNTLVDPSIEGGFVFDINDYRLDASVATQLKRVKQQFIERNKRIV